MRDVAVIALLLVLVIVSAAAGYYVGNSSKQVVTTTTTSTQILSTTVRSTATLPITITETSGQPTTVTTTDYFVLNPKNESTSNLLPDGIMLTLSLNATKLVVGEKQQVTMSLRNTLGTSNSLQPMNDFRFYGLYVPFWGECTFIYPVEMVILKGNLNLIGLETYGYTEGPTDPDLGCMEGTTVNQFTFFPQSDQGNISGVYDVTDAELTTGPYQMAVDFATGGYWNMSNIALGPDTTYVFPVITPSNPLIFGRGPLIQPPSVPFSPGNYTVAVSDEWMQYAILHFTVF